MAQNDFWGNIDVRSGSLNVGYSAPFLVQLPDSNVTNIFVGAFDGGFHVYEIDPDSIMSGTFPKIMDQYASMDEGERANMQMADLNNDGALEMITGNYRGGVTLYREGIPPSGISPTANPALSFDVYPVPASSTLFGKISSQNGQQTRANLQMVDMLGNVVYESSIGLEFEISVANLANGVYLIEIYSVGNSGARKVLIHH